MWEPEHKTTKLGILGLVIALTLSIHYGVLIEPIFGHVHWIHAIHGRFCYIPIVIGAAWFGLRGGLYTALLISALVLPLILGSDKDSNSMAGELADVVFYFAIAFLAGALFDRELRSRRTAENMRLQLERSHKLSLVGQIAAGMAHEIKNPLASVKGAVEILSDEATKPNEREEFRKIVFKEIKRMNNSIMDLLEFARPSEPKFTPMNLGEILNSTTKQVQAQAGKRDITITTQVDDSVNIKGDGEKIHQILLNLVINAIDASEDGSEVTISLNKDDDQRLAILKVEDSGAGINESDLPRVFEPFFTTKSTGTGLGLAIARSIIEKHGGKITLKNKPSGGVIASIELPIVNEEEVPA